MSIVSGLLVGLRLQAEAADYGFCRNIVHELVCDKHFDVASTWADRAMKNRRSVCSFEEVPEELFAYDLLSLGRYSEIETVLRSLPSVAELSSCRETFLSVCRRKLLIKALIGQHKNEQAIQEARKPLACCDKSDQAEIDYLIDEAMLCIADNDSRSSRFCDSDHGRFNDLFNQLMELVEGDNVRAQRIVRNALVLSDDYVDQGLYYLGLFEQIMRRKKCLAAANVFAREIDRVKHLGGLCGPSHGSLNYYSR